MAVTAQATGTENSTVGATPDLLANVDVAGSFVLVIDTNVMQAGDTLIVRIKQIVLTGGTGRTVYVQTYFDVQPTDDKIKISVPVSNELTTETGALLFEINQTTGTTRAYPWKILKL